MAALGCVAPKGTETPFPRLSPAEASVLPVEQETELAGEITNCWGERQ